MCLKISFPLPLLSTTSILNLSLPFFSLTQVFILLCIADWMIHLLWRTGKDPDSYSIPYLTALGDLLGTGLLALAFLLLWLIEDQGPD